MRFYESYRLHLYPEPLSYAQTWMLQRLISFNGASGDGSGAIMLLLLHVSIALLVSGQRQFAHWLQNRAGQGACSVAGMTDADRMVAAGGG
jgi:hypothetical protein